MTISTEVRAERRVELHRLGGAADGFAADVAKGLSSVPKRLPPKHFYDDLGSRLFEAITALPEYYLTRVEAEILAARAGEIASRFAPPVRLIELGSGSSEKTRVLIDALLARQEDLLYVPIDVSAAALERSSRELALEYPRLSIAALAGEFGAAFDWLAAAEERGEVPRGGSTLALFLGSSLGNFDGADQAPFLARVRSRLAAGDGLLLGVDLKKPAELLLPAYDDALGVTAAFNRNLLVRMNRELGGTFDLRSFAHRARYHEGLARIEMHLESLREQTVAIRGLGMEVRFAAGETIHTESSYRFDADGLAALGAASGFDLARLWTDAQGRFASCLFAATGVPPSF